MGTMKPNPLTRCKISVPSGSVMIIKNEVPNRWFFPASLWLLTFCPKFC